MDQKTKEAVNSKIMKRMSKRLSPERFDQLQIRSQIAMVEALPLFVRINKSKVLNHSKCNLAEITGLGPKSILIEHVENRVPDKIAMCLITDIYVQNFNTQEAVWLALSGFVVHKRDKNLFITSPDGENIDIVFNKSVHRKMTPNGLLKMYNEKISGWTIRANRGEEKSFDDFMGGRKVCQTTSSQT